jgi:hypothetical protein
VSVSSGGGVIGAASPVAFKCKGAAGGACNANFFAGSRAAVGVVADWETRIVGARSARNKIADRLPACGGVAAAQAATVIVIRQNPNVPRMSYSELILGRASDRAVRERATPHSRVLA